MLLLAIVVEPSVVKSDVTGTEGSEGGQGATRSPEKHESIIVLDEAKEPVDRGAESRAIFHQQSDSKYC